MKTLTPIKKASFYLTAFVSTLMGASLSHSQNTQQEFTMKEATYIPFAAETNQDANLTHFLTEGARLVSKTEPNTLYWYALKKADGSFGTKIVNFTLSRDNLDIAAVSLETPQNAPDLTDDEAITIRIQNVR